jgi:hypothetical protein
VRFLDRHARDFFEFGDDAVDLGIEILALLIILSDFLAQHIALLIEGVFLLEKGVIASVNGLLAKIQFILIALDFLLHLPDFILSVLLGFEGRLFGVDFRVLGNALGFDLRIANNLLGLLVGALVFERGGKFKNNDSNNDSDHKSRDPDNETNPPFNHP